MLEHRHAHTYTHRSVDSVLCHLYMSLRTLSLCEKQEPKAPVQGFEYLWALTRFSFILSPVLPTFLAIGIYTECGWPWGRLAFLKTTWQYFLMQSFPPRFSQASNECLSRLIKQTSWVKASNKSQVLSLHTALSQGKNLWLPTLILLDSGRKGSCNLSLRSHVGKTLVTVSGSHRKVFSSWELFCRYNVQNLGFVFYLRNKNILQQCFQIRINMGHIHNSKFSNRHSKNKLLEEVTFVLIIYFICHNIYKSKFPCLINMYIINEVFYIFIFFQDPMCIFYE